VVSGGVVSDCVRCGRVVWGPALACRWNQENDVGYNVSQGERTRQDKTRQDKAKRQIERDGAVSGGVGCFRAGSDRFWTGVEAT
jgi:hypothetical protein